jgi:hypothetical protein
MTGFVAAKEDKRVDVHRCHRCAGLMVQEKVFELGSFGWRCVSCGERIDALVLAHRQNQGPKEVAHKEAQRGFGKETPPLNL